MKRFFYVITNSKRRPSSGSRSQTADIYQIKRNIPKLVAVAKWDTGSYYGANTEVTKRLAQKGLIPKKFGDYYREDNGRFVVHHL